jgi:pimeloyl-ACP methyl ester carboxylesterase
VGSAVPRASDQAPHSRVVELKAPDGTLLKATFFPAGKRGPGVLLLHQVNRDRKSWERVAQELAAAGINTLTLDMRGHGDSGGLPIDKLPREEIGKHWRGWPEDAEAAYEWLVSQPDVEREVIGIGGSGLLGVDNGAETARHHSAQIKSLVFLSGETFREGLQYLHNAWQTPALFVVDDHDEYPPTVEAMSLLYVTSSSSDKRFVHYSEAQEAPWLWYEPTQIGRVPANRAHGTDMFERHAELPDMIVAWFVQTLIKTPGRAHPDPVAASAVLVQLQEPGGAAKVLEQLRALRQQDQQAQLFPEISAGIVGADYQRSGDIKRAIEVMELVAFAYPDSADAHGNLAGAYLEHGDREPARQHAMKALAILEARTSPASSWTDTDVFRSEVRRSAERVLKQVNPASQP